LSGKPFITITVIDFDSRSPWVKRGFPG